MDKPNIPNILDIVDRDLDIVIGWVGYLVEQGHLDTASMREALESLQEARIEIDIERRKGK